MLLVTHLLLGIHDVARVAMHATITKVMPNMMPALGSKVKEMRLVSMLVETDASSAS